MIGVLPLYVNVYINIKIYYYYMSVLNYLSDFFSYGPFYLIILSWILLWEKNTLFFYYTVGLFLDTILNLFLKGIFKQPRPYEDPQKFNLAITHGKRFLYKNGMPYDIFGMPSGHSQSVAFTTVFMYFALRKSQLLYVYLTVAICTMLQRMYSNNHYFLQVIVGAGIGGLFGYLMYFLSGQQIIGKITEKLDDFGPI